MPPLCYAKWTDGGSREQPAGVSLAKVKKITIGLGDKANPKAGGAGRIYLDDIYITK
jgi:hypothetical protein